MRRGRLAAALGTVALVLAMPAAPAPRRVSDAVYRIRADLRLCPSPLCGGFFVSRVNRATTPCDDAVSRAWCYVSTLDLSQVPAPARGRLQAAERSGGLLLRGRPVHSEGAPELRSAWTFVAADGWLSATTATWQGTVYLIRDIGIRCVRAPCFSLRASVVNGVTIRSVSGLDLNGVAAPPALVRKAQTAVNASGLLVAGTIRLDKAGVPTSGRTLVGTQFFLPAG